MQLEDELRKALRAEDPGAAFTQRVLARAREERAGQRKAAAAVAEPLAEAGGGAADGHGARVPAMAREGVNAPAAAPASAPASVGDVPRGVRTTRWVAAAVAASMAIAAAGTQWVRYQQYRVEGERARAQVLAALRITSEKLNLVHDKIVATGEPR